MKPHISVIIRTILALTALYAFIGCEDGDRRLSTTLGGNNASTSQSFHTISPEAFMNPPLEARPGAYWCWLNGTVDQEQMTREMEEAKALGMRGFEIWDVGVYRPVNMVPAGPAFLGEESLKNIKHAMTEAKRLGLELNM
ncbi:MAG: glycosyl hydrolase, partial [Candidatus Aminicenantaceae bacterium]